MSSFEINYILLITFCQFRRFLNILNGFQSSPFLMIRKDSLEAKKKLVERLSLTALVLILI